MAIKKLNDQNLDDETIEDFRKEVNILRYAFLVFALGSFFFNL